jgi:Transglycosylase-like domain
MQIRPQGGHLVVRSSLAVGAAVLATLAAATLLLGSAGPASARPAVRPAGASLAELRTTADHYRSLTWAFQRAAHARRTPTSFSYRRSASRTYLRWTVAVWARRSYRAHVRALARIRRRARVGLPHVAPPHASIVRRLRTERALVARLEKIYPGHVKRPARVELSGGAAEALRGLETREAKAALAVAAHLQPVLPPGLVQAFSCIHSYEGSWSSNTGNGYYGGLQMDAGFQQLYGSSYVHRWGTADNWPVWAQLDAAIRAYRSGRGFWPWPNSARICGLI